MRSDTKNNNVRSKFIFFKKYLKQFPIKAIGWQSKLVFFFFNYTEFRTFRREPINASISDNFKICVSNCNAFLWFPASSRKPTPKLKLFLDFNTIVIIVTKLITVSLFTFSCLITAKINFVFAVWIYFKLNEFSQTRKKFYHTYGIYGIFSADFCCTRWNASEAPECFNFGIVHVNWIWKTKLRGSVHYNTVLTFYCHTSIFQKIRRLFGIQLKYTTITSVSWNLC